MNNIYFLLPGRMLNWELRTMGNGFKLKESRFKLDISKKLFPVRVVRPWNRQVFDIPSWKVLKARLGDLEQAEIMEGTPALATGLE